MLATLAKAFASLHMRTNVGCRISNQQSTHVCLDSQKKIDGKGEYGGEEVDIATCHKAMAKKGVSDQESVL